MFATPYPHNPHSKLSVQLDKLQRAGYITVEKGFSGKMPRTTCSMTDVGREAMREYVETLKEYIGVAK